MCVCEYIYMCVWVCIYKFIKKRDIYANNTILKAFAGGHRTTLNGGETSSIGWDGSEGDCKIFQNEPPGSSQKSPRATKRQDISKND